MSSEKKNDDTKDGLLNETKKLVYDFLCNMKPIIHNSKYNENLSNGQIFVLFILENLGSCKVSDIANKIGITSGAVTSISDKLINMGLITRERPENNRRIVMLSLTEQGSQIIYEIKNKKSNFLAEELKELKEEDLEKIIYSFSKLNSILEKYNV